MGGGFLRVDFLSAKHIPQILCGVPQNMKVCPAEKFFLVGKYAGHESFCVVQEFFQNCTYTRVRKGGYIHVIMHCQKRRSDVLSSGVVVVSINSSQHWSMSSSDSSSSD